ncbi:polyprenyl synthetase family protein [Lacisediminihabitans profunda]|uniref:Polyprenyl synthetase family protein n=1 Tax=Lacisediminihabitans profunda TaxID=2594790 RepID=A0A5C8UQ96_9MICO|nr:polyprenyl synthetase family protein [Lacisediminihabitans profunda]TXN30673.1 polyprenyl synthetase family protein [Lacisediminihabitans profunda]
MAESTRLVDLVQADIDGFLDGREPLLSSIGPDLSPLIDFSRDLLRGGKRFRALFCYWGWQSVSGHSTGFDPAQHGKERSDLAAVVKAASALEMFHAAALVHDDIMDSSDMRRGMPAAHKRFESLHTDGGWNGSPRTFGQSAALLLGDLLLGWSDELFDAGLRELPDLAAREAARLEFNRMRTEVTVGQYLDILEERSWRSYPEPELLARAHRVIVYKSAKYSIEAPLAIGAALAGGSIAQVSALREFGLPLGIAYQLRDDLLGVFGDPQTTGKPAGDDLREGKRTVLIALARTNLAPNATRLLDELLGDTDLSAQQVSMLQASIRECGAVEQVERIIDHNVRIAIEAIENAPVSTAAREQLVQLADTVSNRSA